MLLKINKLSDIKTSSSMSRVSLSKSIISKSANAKNDK